MANLVSRRQFTIEWGHCDPAGIVFNARFFEFFDWGTWALFEMALGVKPQDLAGAFGIVGIPLVDSGARFIGPARFGDVVELTSQVTAFRRSSFDVEHRLMVGGAVAVEGRETRVWATRDPADATKLKSLPIPPEVTARFGLP
ncbi:MAG: thioesterase family protein [Xanthobacteraceae bacterium]